MTTCTLEQVKRCATYLKELCSQKGKQSSPPVEIYICGSVVAGYPIEELCFVLEVGYEQYGRFRDACIAYNNELHRAAESRARMLAQEETQGVWAQWRRDKLHWFARKTKEPDCFYLATPSRTVRAKKALLTFDLTEGHLRAVAQAGDVSWKLINMICLPKGWKNDSALQSQLRNEIPSDDDPELDRDSLQHLIETAKRFFVNEEGIPVWG